MHLTTALRMLLSGLAMIVLWGCSPRTSPGGVEPGASTHHHEHRSDSDHHHAAEPSGEPGSTPAHSAPHGGGLTALGREEAHLEITLDPNRGQVDIYLLDSHAAGALRAENHAALRLQLSGPEPWTLELQPVADPLSGETERSTSRFQAVSEKLRGQSSLQGAISELNLKGQTYRDIPVDFPHGIPETSILTPTPSQTPSS